MRLDGIVRTTDDVVREYRQHFLVCIIDDAPTEIDVAAIRPTRRGRFIDDFDPNAERLTGTDWFVPAQVVHPEASHVRDVTLAVDDLRDEQSDGETEGVEAAGD